jgi:hypothetical protein
MTRKKPKQSRAKKGAWFVPVRGSYLPVSTKGWLTYVPFIVYLVFALIIGWRNSAEIGTVILFVVPNWVAATVVMTWLAAHKS